MNGVDRDFDRNGGGRFFWPLTYLLVALGYLDVFAGLWKEIHLRGWSPTALVHLIPLSLILICPLVASLRFRRYERCALKGNLISERVANNCEFWIGLQLMIVYSALIVAISRI
jgi:hypothetical protein